MRKPEKTLRRYIWEFQTRRVIKKRERKFFVVGRGALMAKWANADLEAILSELSA